MYIDILKVNKFYTEMFWSVRKLYPFNTASPEIFQRKHNISTQMEIFVKASVFWFTPADSARQNGFYLVNAAI